ncbi:MAG: hypothetical protein GQ559_02145, partial [Desulfobulbaceae bacterium]|nr:hypothetical protein [Desulfobulbaceae bacterium]
MIKKQKKKKRKKRSVTIPAGNLPAVGKQYLTQGKFSEAIKIFRRLHKETGDEKWSGLLRTALTGRIRQLTAKGMFKEALIIYGNLVAVFPDHCPDLHIYLLANTGRFREAVQVYNAADGTLTGKQKQTIDELLAALFLGGWEKFLEFLPQDSALCLQYPHAHQALQAYCLKQDNKALEHLHNIPFRSPYKNFRLALKGMIMFHGRSDEALSFFEKIDPASPFLQITVPYRQLAAKSRDQAVQLSSLDRQIIQSLEGLDKNTLRFLDSLDTCNKTPSALYQYLVSAGKCLGKKRLRQLCYRLLPHAPEKFPDFLRRFDWKSEKFDIYRLQALAMEIKDEYYGIAEAWQEACDELTRKNNPDDHLKIALLYRHIAEMMEKERAEYSSGEIYGQLEKSLEY